MTTLLWVCFAVGLWAVLLSYALALCKTAADADRMPRAVDWAGDIELVEFDWPER